nr:hypothetical protein BdHM001_34660 [Bdellovibrio sp. HM001]
MIDSKGEQISLGDTVDYSPRGRSESGLNPCFRSEVKGFTECRAIIAIFTSGKRRASKRVDPRYLTKVQK